jgi:UTP--glucose-1-phosphate uridylyltransferase
MDGFKPIAEKMRREQLPEVAISTFGQYYRQLVAGVTGEIGERGIEPVADVPDAERLGNRDVAAGRTALAHTVVVNLNGGLGTSMGLAQAKSLLPVKNGRSFLDFLALQAVAADVPLVLMDSFATQADSLAVLGRHQALRCDLPPDFVQHKVPKIAAHDFSAVSWPANPQLEWCPPGHGDFYTALVTSGMLARMRERGFRYAFVSNADNLGASLDVGILGHFARSGAPFMMEVADRTAADRKGGHLARLADGSGRLVLRESAQCPKADEAAFQDVTRHRYFNTNTLWLDLAALERILRERDNFLGLPMIRNVKTVDPRDPASTRVYQLETAIGAAIAVFDGATALRVPRRRFAPVKTTDDLLAVRSDATIISAGDIIVPNPARSIAGPPIVRLDPRFFRMIADFEARFPAGAPSLRDCASLTVEGDVKFGAGVVCRGDVNLVNRLPGQLVIADGTILEG